MSKGLTVAEELEELEVAIVNESETGEFRKFLDEIEGSEDKFNGAVPRDGLTTVEKRNVTRQENKLEKKYEGQAGVESQQDEHDILRSYDYFDVVEPPHNLDYLAKLYELSPAHAACVRAKVSNIVGLGYKFHENELTKIALRNLDSKARTKKFEELAELKLYYWNWTEKTNKEDTFVEVLKKMWTDVETMGNGYIEIGRKRNNEIGYIGHIPAQTMRVRRDRDGYVQIVGRKANYFRKFGEKTAPPFGNNQNPNEVIHFKKYNPANSWYGIPDIMPAINNITGNEFAERFNIEYFENKAVPRYIVLVKNAKLGEESQRKIINFFQNIKGQSHRTVIIPLESQIAGKDAELTIEPVEAKIQDASFVKYFALNNSEIFMAHRVPASKVTTVSGTSLAAARDADKNFKEQVARPEQEIIETKLGPIWSDKQELFHFKLNEMSLTDEDTRSKIEERRLKTQESTPNEVRARRGEIGREGGDEVLPIFDKAGPSEKSRQRESLRPSEQGSKRSAEAPDNDGEARNASGEGRKVE